MKLSLNSWILVGAVAGVLLGLGLGAAGSESAVYQQGVYACGLVGSLFVDLLKMVLIPLVFTSIAVGIASLRAHARMHQVWTTTLAWFVGTTMLSASLGLLVINFFRPGQGLSLELFREAMGKFQAKSLSLSQFAVQFLDSLVMNPVEALAKGEVLATVFFALLLGIALVVMGDKVATLRALLEEGLELVLKLVSWIMVLAPVGIMALLARLIATQDVTLLKSLAAFVGVVLGTTVFHGAVILPGLLWAFSGMGPGRFFSGAREALVTALATSSSSATLPITLRCTEENLKVDKDIAGFVVPLGATVNMNGTALYEAAAALFVANLTGLELNLLQQVVVVLTASLAAIGAPGIPSAGMVTMVMVLQAVGLPAEAVAILLPIDRPLDAVRTMVNVLGDMAGAVIVQKRVSRAKPA